MDQLKNKFQIQQLQINNNKKAHGIEPISKSISMHIKSHILIAWGVNKWLPTALRVLACVYSLNDLN